MRFVKADLSLFDGRNENVFVLFALAFSNNSVFLLKKWAATCDFQKCDIWQVWTHASLCSHL